MSRSEIIQSLIDSKQHLWSCLAALTLLGFTHPNYNKARFKILDQIKSIETELRYL